MANVAFVRRVDVNLPNVAEEDEAPTSLNKIELATGGTPESQNAVTTALKVIVTYIPTEVLTLYVAILGAIQVPNSASTQTTKGTAAEAANNAAAAAAEAANVGASAPWTVFYCFLVATPVIVWLVFAAKVHAANKPLPLAPRTWPLWEMFAATVAYTVWACALPNSVFTAGGGWFTPALAGVLVLIVSTVLGLLAPLFQRPLPA
jgi:hypothetical protein